ncbi:MAG: superoxide dismutase [Bacteroidales bacterium]|nr:superoxide dismutase [Bacteroidales bacterium]
MKLLLTTLILMIMNFDMPKLPYANDALQPVISEETINFHYGKHLQNYVNTLNNLIKGTEYENKSLNDIVKTAPDGGIFNNAGQVLNHTLYFLQFTGSQEQKEPKGKLAEAIKRDFGSFQEFQNAFNEASTTLFGSGWSWLSVDQDGKLQITKETNGSNPLRHGLKPLLGFDVWEHSYYLDYQNRRADHIKALWDIIDWPVVEKRFEE